MKKCPHCGTQYSDVTLSYCLQDGTPLEFVSQADTPTVALDERETRTARGPLTADDRKSGSKTAIAVTITAAVMLVLFAAIGIGAWLYFRNSPVETTRNTDRTTSAASPGQNFSLTAIPTSTPKVAPSAAQSTTPSNASSPASAGDYQARLEISQKIDNWNSMLESKNMNGLRSVYAPVLQVYYSKRNLSSERVIDDKERAFGKYSSIRINVSRKSITTYPSGDDAMVVLEKDWRFEGETPFCGVVRSELRLRKMNGDWLIVGERDVPGTFRRTC
jgi:hypothetical protein